MSVRILAVTNIYPTQATPGQSPFIRDQLAALQSKGVDVDLLYVDRLRGKRGYLEGAREVLRRTRHGGPYDLVHAYYGLCGFLARLQTRYPVVVTFVGSDILGRRDGLIGKAVAKRVAGVIVMSGEMARASGRADARVVPFGVNMAVYKPLDQSACRQALGLSGEEKLILFPWDPQRPVKRYDLVQAAMALLNANGERAKLVVIYDKPQETVAQYMNACDAMILASDHEGSPVSVREALACNLPIVSVNVGDVAQLLEGVPGCYICSQDAPSLASHLALVLDAGSRARGVERVQQLDANWAADQVLDLYRTVLAKS